MGNSARHSWHKQAAIAEAVDVAACRQAVVRAWSQQRERSSVGYGMLIGHSMAFRTALESATLPDAYAIQPTPPAPRTATRLLTLQFGETESS